MLLRTGKLDLEDESRISKGYGEETRRYVIGKALASLGRLGTVNQASGFCGVERCWQVLGFDLLRKQASITVDLFSNCSENAHLSRSLTEARKHMGQPPTD